jgi:hypothetical protein
MLKRQTNLSPTGEGDEDRAFNHPQADGAAILKPSELLRQIDLLLRHSVATLKGLTTQLYVHRLMTI